MRKALVGLALAAAAVVAVVIAAIGGSNGHAGEHEAPAARPIVDPNAKPAQVRGKPHVLVLVLDEMTIDSILGPNRRIDHERFPNFAGLALNSTWFRNASTIYDSTPKAVPLIFDGKRPYKGQPADRRGHSPNLYDALGRSGYRIFDSEEATALCPARYCRGARRRRPRILRNLAGGRQERFQAWMATIGPSRKPTFWVKHALLPHGPYLFLPSGARTRDGFKDPVSAMNTPRGFHDTFLTHHNYQRYLLQIGFVDREIGRLFRRLIDQGLWDRTLIAIVADHGYAWEIGVDDRRRVTQRNVDELGPVPLFIKAPGQRRGKIDSSYVTTLDVTPTIADILNLRLGFRPDGRSAFSRRVRRRRQLRLPTRSFDRVVRISARRYEARRRGQIARRLQLFGSGSSGLFSRIGPNTGLVGRPVARLPRGRAGRLRGALYRARRLVAVRRASGLVPSQIAGRVSGGKRGRRRDVAVAVNGRIEAVGRTFRLKHDRREYFAVMVPETSLREGRNAVEVFEVRRGRLLRLAAL